jgi:hypothetical protein
MIGILLTILAVVLVICLAFCYSGRHTLVNEQSDRKPAKKG